MLAPLAEQCLNLMCDIEENEDWYTINNVDDEDNVTVGESSLNHVAMALSGKVM